MHRSVSSKSFSSSCESVFLFYLRFCRTKLHSV